MQFYFARFILMGSIGVYLYRNIIFTSTSSTTATHFGGAQRDVILNLSLDFS